MKPGSLVSEQYWIKFWLACNTLHVCLLLFKGDLENYLEAVKKCDYELKRVRERREKASFDQ
jgi:hypothetical protein